jgi:hypothetical protein
MRALVLQAITSEPALTALIPADRWIQAGSLDEMPARPFAVIRLIDGTQTIVYSEQPRFEIWVHDDRGSYIKIDQILRLVRETLIAAVPMEDANYRIVDVDWTGNGPDLIDEGYNTNVRTARFTLTGRK